MIKNPRPWFLFAALYLLVQPFLRSWMEDIRWEKELASDPTIMDCTGAGTFISLFFFAYGFLFAFLSLVFGLLAKQLSDVAATVLFYVIFGLAALPFTILNIIQWINL